MAVIYLEICIYIWLQYSASVTSVFQSPYTWKISVFEHTSLQWQLCSGSGGSSFISLQGTYSWPILTFYYSYALVFPCVVLYMIPTSPSGSIEYPSIHLLYKVRGTSTLCGWNVTTCGACDWMSIKKGETPLPSGKATPPLLCTSLCSVPMASIQCHIDCDPSCMSTLKIRWWLIKTHVDVELNISSVVFRMRAWTTCVTKTTSNSTRIIFASCACEEASMRRASSTWVTVRGAVRREQAPETHISSRGVISHLSPCLRSSSLRCCYYCTCKIVRPTVSIAHDSTAHCEVGLLFFSPAPGVLLAPTACTAPVSKTRTRCSSFKGSHLFSRSPARRGGGGQRSCNCPGGRPRCSANGVCVFL